VFSKSGNPLEHNGVNVMKMWEADAKIHRNLENSKERERKHRKIELQPIKNTSVRSRCAALVNFNDILHVIQLRKKSIIDKQNFPEMPLDEV
jgi:hypothetical protein